MKNNCVSTYLCVEQRGYKVREEAAPEGGSLLCPGPLVHDWDAAVMPGVFANISAPYRNRRYASSITVGSSAVTGFFVSTHCLSNDGN